MSDINDRCLNEFPTWLRALDEDVQTFLESIKSDELDMEARRFLTGGVNYLFRSLDLIPDGIDDIGYLDDAFILRLTARLAMECEIGPLDAKLLARLGRLANEVDLIKEFLEADTFDRLEKYARDLRKGAARGRTVDEILEEKNIMREFSREADAFAKEYTSPGFTRDEKNLIKLKAFFDAKLPK